VRSAAAGEAGSVAGKSAIGKILIIGGIVVLTKITMQLLDCPSNPSFS
jgi:hypothetical protein